MVGFSAVSCRKKNNSHKHNFKNQYYKRWHRHYQIYLWFTWPVFFAPSFLLYFYCICGITISVCVTVTHIGPGFVAVSLNSGKNSNQWSFWGKSKEIKGVEVCRKSLRWTYNIAILVISKHELKQKKYSGEKNLFEHYLKFCVCRFSNRTHRFSCVKDSSKR